MSLFKIITLTTAFIVISSCGFRPVYWGEGINLITHDLPNIRISTISERNGQIMHNFLRDRLNPQGHTQTPIYNLVVRVSVYSQEIGLKFTEEATRAKLTVTANYSLTQNSTDEIVTEGVVRSVNSYNLSDSEYARVAAERDASNRAFRELSDEIKTHLILIFAKLRTKIES